MSLFPNYCFLLFLLDSAVYSLNAPIQCCFFLSLSHHKKNIQEHVTWLITLYQCPINYQPAAFKYIQQIH